MSTNVPPLLKDAMESDREAGVLAREMAAAFGGMVKFYREQYGLSPEEARQRAQDIGAPAYQEWLRNQPPDQVSWFDLNNLAERDPQLARQRWEEIKAAALQELRTGHRAAKILEVGGPDCWDRAKFFAIRDDLAQGWQPRNGIERQLIDVMAQAQSSYFYWLGTLTARATLETVRDRRREEEQGRWSPPRVTDAEALEQAAAMVDRFNRIFLRTLRALRDLRRYAPAVIVQTRDR